MSSRPVETFEAVTNRKALCAESPVWNDMTNSLCWTDIDGKMLHRFTPATRERYEKTMSGRVGCIALQVSGGYMAAMEDEILSLTPNFDIVHSFGRAGFDPNLERFNDGKLDRQGKFFWVGSIYLPRDKKSASIWRLSENGQMGKVITDVTTTNGIAWSPDGRTMYFADSWHHIIWAADYDTERGTIANQREFFHVPPSMGRPDGATVDNEGFYWCAVFGGSCLLRISPDGVLDRKVLAPTKYPTMPCFGGDSYGELFLTSFGDVSQIQGLENDPHSGLLFKAKTKFSGLAEAHMSIPQSPETADRRKT
jgi:sugar lactone lactonase YvrE